MRDEGYPGNSIRPGANTHPTIRQRDADMNDDTSTHATGISPAELDDATLRREMSHLHETRHETVLSATAAALDNHTSRMLELEAEFLRRFPSETVPNARRT